MASPKKPHTLQLSRPDAVNENYSRPEKRSPISSRIWQEEDPTRKSGFCGEDLSMRNFCVSVQGDHDLMESFSFDTDADRFLETQRGNSIDVLTTLPEQETNEWGNPSSQEHLKPDLNRREINQSEKHSHISQEDSIHTASVVHKEIKIIQKEGKDAVQGQDNSKSDEIKKDSFTPVILQPKAEQELPQKESTSEVVLLDSTIIKYPGNYADTFDKSFSNLKEKLNVELEMAKDRIASHRLDVDDTSPKPETSNITSKAPSVVEYINKETAGLETNTCRVEGRVTEVIETIIHSCTESKIDSSMDTHKNTAEDSAANIAADKDFCSRTDSAQLTPTNQDINTQARTKVEYRSIAVSPIIPPEGCSSFTFQTGESTQGTTASNFSKERTEGKTSFGKEDISKNYSFELTPPNQEAGAAATVQFRSVAVSPIIPPEGSSSFTFQSEHNSQTPHRTDIRNVDNLPKTYSFELTPPNMDVGTDTRVECKSAAVSPIIPTDDNSFTFHQIKSPSNIAAVELPKTFSFELTPPNQDIGTQVDTRAECVSVAVSPIIPPDGSSSFTFQSAQIGGSSNLGGKESSTITALAENQPSEGIQNQDTHVQAGTKVQLISVALSPIVPPDGSSSFTFQREKAAQGTESDKKNNKNDNNIDNVQKTEFIEITTPNEKAMSKPTVEYKSVAVSPIIPPGEDSFTFQFVKKKELTSAVKSGEKHPDNVDLLPKTYSFELTPPCQDVGTQAENKIECVSVAVSPFVFSPAAAHSFTFQSEQRHQEQSPKSLEAKQEPCCTSALPNTYSLVLTPQNQDVGTQADTRAQCISVAVSPIVPLDGSCSFLFHTDGVNQGLPVSSCSHMQEKPSMKDVEMQVSFPVETRSIATDPMTPEHISSKASYPEVHVKESKVDHPEPVREVSWDEKGMTWEVYGASMEVEVLGMAIQKHLEKQIEEHGRQKVMTPQTTRGSSVRGVPLKGEGKRPPNAIRSFFHCVRRPRCCSRAGQTVE